MCLAKSRNLLPVLQDAPKRISPTNSRSLGQPKTRQRHFFSTLHPLSPIIFATATVVAFVLLRKSRFSFHSLPSRFLSRRCFTLCTTMEVEPRLVQQYKCHHCCNCKNYRGKGMEGGKKGLCKLYCFLADQKIASSWKKCVSGQPIVRATSYCLLPGTFWL